MNDSKEPIIVYADKLTNILKKEGIKWITGMKKKHRFACVMIPVGYPKEDPKTGEMVQKYQKRYLSSELTDLLRSSKITK